MNLIITKTDLKERNYLSAKIIKPENKTENPADDRTSLEYAAEILLKATPHKVHKLEIKHD